MHFVEGSLMYASFNYLPYGATKDLVSKSFFRVALTEQVIKEDCVEIEIEK